MAVLITGATGFLGSHLMASFLEKGEEVIVVGRRSQKVSLIERIDKLLNWFGLEEKKHLVETWETDLLRNDLGLSPEVYYNLCRKTKSVIHCASDTRFSECFRAEIISVNTKPLTELIKFAGEAKVDFFHHISTVYVAGKTEGLCSESLPENNGFFNVYEESKAQAEKIVARECSNANVPYTIIRPSVVYGDSRTGRSNGFSALYFNMKSLYYLKNIYVNDLLKNAGKKAKKSGVFLDGEYLNLPLRLFLPAEGKINLIPIEYFISAVMTIISSAISQKIYHITTDRPRTSSELVGWCEKFLMLRGLEIRYEEIPKGSFTPAEDLFNMLLNPYIPYLSDTRDFDRSITDLVYPVPSPEMTYEIFERCMNYAIDADWKFQG